MRSRRRDGLRSIPVEALEDRILLIAEMEPNATPVTATEFIAGDSLTGLIRDRSDVDYFRTTLNVGDVLAVTSSRGYRQYTANMEIVTAAGDVAAVSGEGGRIEFVAPVTGTFFVRLTSENENGFHTQHYEFRTEVTAFARVTESDGNDSIETADSLGSDHFVGTLDDSADVDFFSFSSGADWVVTIDFANLTSANPATELFAPDGSSLATDDTGLGLSVALPQDGTYTLAVAANNAAGNVTGEYAGHIRRNSIAFAADETGHDFESAHEIKLGPSVVASRFLSADDTFTAHGLVGSYVDASLRDRSAHDDWRTTETIAGTRTDPVIHFPNRNWGLRSEVSLTGGTELDWDNFSVQWDGYLRVVTDGTTVNLASDDGSRLWIDVNGDGVFASDSSEFFDNEFGSGHPTRLGTESSPLPAGDYQIRIQYEEGTGTNTAYLLWSDEINSAGARTSGYRTGVTSTLESMDDVDVYKVHLNANSMYEADFASSGGRLGAINREISIYNEYGQLLDAATFGVVDPWFRNQRAQQSGTHYVTVKATSEFGLGTYQLRVQEEGEFPHYRDVPLYHLDFSNYGEEEFTPAKVAILESMFDSYQIDVTLDEAGDREHLWCVRDG